MNDSIKRFPPKLDTELAQMELLVNIQICVAENIAIQKNLLDRRYQIPILPDWVSAILIAALRIEKQIIGKTVYELSEGNTLRTMERQLSGKTPIRVSKGMWILGQIADLFTKIEKQKPDLAGLIISDASIAGMSRIISEFEFDYEALRLLKPAIKRSDSPLRATANSYAKAGLEFRSRTRKHRQRLVGPVKELQCEAENDMQIPRKLALIAMGMNEIDRHLNALIAEKIQTGGHEWISDWQAPAKRLIEAIQADCLFVTQITDSKV